MIEINGIDHMVLHVKDPQRSKQLYTEVLGMTVYRDFTDQVYMHAGGQGVALFRRKGTPAGGDLNHLALNVAAGTLREPKKPSWRHTASRSAAGRATIAAFISATPTVTGSS